MSSSAIYQKVLRSGAFCVLGAASLVLAGPTRTIQASRSFTVSPVVISSTYDVQPQIQPDPPFSVPQVAAENDYTPPLPLEASNSLHAGGLMTSSRGSVKKYFPGPVDGRFVPPDNNFAVGPNQIVCVINTTIAFYSKSGTQLFKQQMDGASGFFAGVAQTNFVFDPKAFYDPISNRFFVVALDLDEGGSISNALVAVSDDNNPGGTWYKYRIDAVLNSGGAGYWMDYPGYGFNKDAIVITGNMFGFSGGVFGTEALVIKKPSLLTGGTAQVSVVLDPTSFTLQPTRTTDKNNDKIWGVSTGGGNAMRFFAFTNLTGSPILKEIDVPVPAYNRPPGPAPSGGNVIDTLDGRTMTAHYRLNQVVAAHTIGKNGAIAVRWYDFNCNNWPTSGSPTLKQSGDISGNGVAMHMPAININSFEDISVFYTRSSASIPADLVVSSRFKSDPLGQMGAPVKMAGSTSSTYQSFRWGDYFGNEIDPVDDSTFWGFGMVVGNNGAYATHIVSWQVTAGGVAGTTVPPSTVNPFVGSYIIGGVADVATSDDLYYQVGSVGIPQFGQAAGVEETFTIPTDTTAITISFEDVAGIAGGTNMVWLYNWSTNSFNLIGSTPMSATGNLQRSLIVRSTDVLKYIGPGGAVRMQLRGHLPIKPFQNTIPNPFTFKIDKSVLIVR